LEQSLKQRLRFKIERDVGGALPNMPADGWDVSRNTDNDQWVELEPGAYRVIVNIVNTDKVSFLERRIFVANGDYLLASVTRDSLDRFDFERVLYGNDYGWKPRREQDGWLLSALQNQLKPDDRSLEMLVTLENSKDRAPKDGTLRQIKPRGVWLEVKPEGTDTPVAVRWREVVGYPAPAWGLRISDWPARPGGTEPARPVLRAWWNAEEDFPSAARLRRIPNENFETAFLGLETEVEQDAANRVAVESVTVESREVEDRPGEKVSCLVVRLRFPKGKPVWVQPEGLNLQGQEHRFYYSAEKYTGIFWEVDQATVQDKLTALNLLSVDKFKNARSVTSVEIVPPNRPDSEARPKTVPELIQSK
jgi:hypothetical protein